MICGMIYGLEIIGVRSFCSEQVSKSWTIMSHHSRYGQSYIGQNLDLIDMAGLCKFFLVLGNQTRLFIAV